MNTETKHGLGVSAMRRLKKESHRRQFDGEDYQQVVFDLLQSEADPTEDELIELESSPDPACDCGFCATADWRE